MLHHYSIWLESMSPIFRLERKDILQIYYTLFLLFFLFQRTLTPVLHHFKFVQVGLGPKNIFFYFYFPTIFQSDYEGHAKTVVNYFDPTIDGIVVAGGNGTIQEVCSTHNKV